MLAPWVAYGRNSGKRAIPGSEARRVVLFRCRPKHRR